MSKLKINENLFLGKFELNRLVDFLSTNGYKQDFVENMESYGLLRNELIDGQFNNFHVTTSNNKIDISAGLAYDKLGQVIFNKNDITGLSIPTTNNWYWVRISYLTKPIEKGTVTLDPNGNLVGTGTEFLTTLRGQPNFTTRIRLYKDKGGLFPANVTATPSVNALDYDVQSVSNDTTAILSGDIFYIDNPVTLYYSVVGTFTPGTIIPSVDKEILQYDDVYIEFIQEQTTNTPPPILAQNVDLQFYIARVFIDSGNTVTIHDKRTNFFKTRAEQLTSNLNTNIVTNIVALNRIKHNTAVTPQSDNLLYMQWAFHCTAYTISTNTNTITMLAGSGGNWDSVATIGSAARFRLYIVDEKISTISPNIYKEGKYIKVLSSNSSTGEIVLETLNPDDFIDKNGIANGVTFILVPDAEEIEFAFFDSSISNNQIPFSKQVFPISEIEGICKVDLLTRTSNVIDIRYRFKTFKHYTEWAALSINLVGYTNELGTLVPYTSSDSFTLIPAATTYSNFNLGDVNRVWYENRYGNTPYLPIQPILKTLTVGTDEQWQIFRTDLQNATPTPSVVFTNTNPEYSIVLDNTNIREGNKWIIDFKMNFAIDDNVAFNIKDSDGNIVLDIRAIWEKYHPIRPDLGPGRGDFVNVGFCALIVYDSNAIGGTIPPTTATQGGEWRVRHFSESSDFIDVLTAKYLQFKHLSDTDLYGAQQGEFARFNFTTKKWERYEHFFKQSKLNYEAVYNDTVFFRGTFPLPANGGTSITRSPLPDYTSAIRGFGNTVAADDDINSVNHYVPLFTTGQPVSPIDTNEITVPYDGLYRLIFYSDLVNLDYDLTNMGFVNRDVANFYTVFTKNLLTTTAAVDAKNTIITETYDKVTFNFIFTPPKYNILPPQVITSPHIQVRNEKIVTLNANDIINVCAWNINSQDTSPGVVTHEGNNFEIFNRTLSVERIS